MPTPSASLRRRAPQAGGVLVLVVALAVGWWWVAQRRAIQQIEGELQAMGVDALPSPDSPVDPALASLGSDLFQMRCAACHAITGESRLGPDLSGVTLRRELAWIRAMVLRPDSMVLHDRVARALKEDYEVQMLVSGTVTEIQTLALIEFLRQVDQPGA